MTSRISRAAVLLFATILTARCQTRASSLRSQPTLFLDLSPEAHKTQAAITLELPRIIAPSHGTPSVVANVASLTPSVLALAQPPEVSKLRIACVRQPDVFGRDDTTSGKHRAQCIYMGVDLHDALIQPVASEEERNRLLHLYMNISTANCNTYLTRVFANKAGIDTVRNTSKDFATALAAGTAKVAATFATNIGLLNLISGSVLDNYNNAVYAEKTFQVLAAAIAAERDVARANIFRRARLDMRQYTYYEALQDIQAFDNACSIERGLERLAELANKEKEEQAVELQTARGDQAAELRRELENFRKQREIEQTLLNQAVQQLLSTTDATQRAAMQQEVDRLREQLAQTNSRLEASRSQLAAAVVPIPAAVPPAVPAPVQPENQQPAQPQNQQPAQPQNQQPAQPENQQPAQPENQQPAQPQNQQPAQPQNQQPAQPQNQQPAQPQNQQPVNSQQQDE